MLESHTCNAEVSRTCYKQTLSTTNVVDNTAYSSASASRRLDTNRPAVKRLELKTSRPIEKRNFTSPPALALPFG